MASTAPIGVFDSGLGGISVAREIRRDMPNEHVLYFGDSANAPYGTKSPEQVRELSDVIVKRFVEQGVKAVVIACNTATAVHYKVGSEVREAIEKIGGTMPEDLPTPEKSIAQLEKEQLQRLKQQALDGQLMLDE